MTPKSFGEVQVGPGKKDRGFVKVARKADGSWVQIPVMVVAGTQEGPTLLVDNGVHGDEYEGGEAVRRIWRELDPATLRGTFVGVPAVNLPAFDVGGRANAIDHINLNRVFPGKKDGWLTERLAYAFFEEIVRKVDAVVDLHGGGNILLLSPMTIYRELEDPALTQRAYALARSAGLDLLWKGGGAWGGPINMEAMKIGIPTITVEIGGEGRCVDEVVDMHAGVIRNVLKHLKMVDGSPQVPARYTRVSGTFQFANHGGLIRPRVRIRQMVKQHELISVILDVFGDVVEEVRAPYGGMVCSLRTFPTIQPGEWTVLVGQVVDTVA